MASVERTYLDHNATSPLRAEARAAMLAAMDAAGNPSSIHAEGRAARAIVEAARETVAAAFETKPGNVIFTSGGTEAANTVLNLGQATPAVLMAATEHPCILNGFHGDACKRYVIPVSADGIVDLTALQNALAPGTVLTVQAANNETGVIQPIADLAVLAHDKGAVLVCDAVQALGRLPLSHLKGADAAFISAHKFGGPKGVGAIVLLKGSLALEPLLKGGGQERRRRSGTENVVGIAGLHAALNVALRDQDAQARRLGQLRSQLETGLRAMASDVAIFGERAERLTNTVCFAIPGLRAEMALIAFDLEGVAVSSGSACSSGKVERSHVLSAMGVPEILSEGAIRVSMGWTTTAVDIERFLTVLTKIDSGRRNRHAA